MEIDECANLDESALSAYKFSQTVQSRRRMKFFSKIIAFRCNFFTFHANNSKATYLKFA